MAVFAVVDFNGLPANSAITSTFLSPAAIALPVVQAKEPVKLVVVIDKAAVPVTAVAVLLILAIYILVI